MDAELWGEDWQMDEQAFCTEGRVREIVRHEVARSVIAYETRIGGPRHAQNQKLISRIDGGVTLLKWMGGVATVFCAIATAYFAWLRH
jgi:hypothetical protein